MLVRQSTEQGRKCQMCGRPMTFFHGCHWDYDIWYCLPSLRYGGCGAEVVLDTTTCPENMDEDGNEIVTEGES